MPTTAEHQDAVSPRIAECVSCGGWFTLGEHTDGARVACPHCDAIALAERLEVREAPLAEVLPAEPAVAPSVESVGEEAAPLVSEHDAPAEVASEPSDDRPPTVGEWLMRNGVVPSFDPTTGAHPSEPSEPEPSAAIEPTPSAEAETKPSLAESLGWRPESFDSAGLTTSPSETERPAEPAPVREPADEFRFDFSSTPLTEPTEANEPRAEDPQHSGVHYDDQANVATAAGELGYVEDAPKSRRSWFAPMAAAAGFLVVAGPIAYFVTTLPDGTVAAVEGVEQPIAEATETAEPFVPAQETQAEADPIVDPATQPASFNAPADAPPLPAQQEPEAPRYPATLGDRYGAPEPADEPKPFTLPEDMTPASSPVEPNADEFAPVQPVEPAPATTEPDLAPVERSVPIDAPTTPVADPVVTPPSGLINPPRYQFAELDAALRESEDAARGFAAGTLSDPAQVPTMGTHYARLCRLAEVVTLLDPAAEHPELLTTELGSTDLFKRLFRTQKTREESRLIAGPWVSWTGKPHGGVFFAGIPTRLDRVGEYAQYEYQVGDQVVPVVMAERINVQRYLNAGAKEVGIIGVVVERPSERIAGYTGDADRVVWARKTLPLPAPSSL